MKLDLEDSNVQVIETKVLTIRDGFDKGLSANEILGVDLDLIFDNAQAQAQDQGVAYIVIEVRQ